jgi:hypothetical protein
MNITQDISTEATCTTCSFSEDFSNYWTPVMYFRATNGSFKRVPQIANQYLGSVGGMTVYYMTPDDTTTNITAFKPVSFLYECYAEEKPTLIIGLSYARWKSFSAYPRLWWVQLISVLYREEL